MPGHGSAFPTPGAIPSAAPSSAGTGGLGNAAFGVAMNPAVIGMTGGMSAVAGLAGKGIGMAVDYFKNRNNDVKQERSELLNRQNAFNMAIAGQKLNDPAKALKDFQQSRNMAGRLSLGGMKDAGDFGKSNASGRVGASKEALQLAKSFSSLKNTNLQEGEGGILEFLAPKLEQAISEKMQKKGADFGNFFQGGEKQGFGTEGGVAHEKEEKEGRGGIFGFLEKMIPGLSTINKSLGATVGKLPGVSNVMGGLGKITPGTGKFPGEK